jgi:predicted transcriptional regulator
MSYDHIHKIIEDQTNHLIMIEKKIEEVRKQMEILKELIKQKENNVPKC